MEPCHKHHRVLLSYKLGWVFFRGVPIVVLVEHSRAMESEGIKQMLPPNAESLVVFMPWAEILTLFSLQRTGSMAGPATPSSFAASPSSAPFLFCAFFCFRRRTKCDQTSYVQHTSNQRFDPPRLFYPSDSPCRKVSLLSMRVLCRFYNDVQIVLGGMAVMIVACLMFVTKPEGNSGLPLFLIAVFLMYSVGYPIGHTAVRKGDGVLRLCRSRWEVVRY